MASALRMVKRKKRREGAGRGDTIQAMVSAVSSEEEGGGGDMVYDEVDRWGNIRLLLFFLTILRNIFGEHGFPRKTRLVSTKQFCNSSG